MTLGKTLHIHCSGLPGDGALQAHMIALLERWSCKGHLLLTLEKTLHAHLGLLGDRAH